MTKRAAEVIDDELLAVSFAITAQHRHTDARVSVLYSVLVLSRVGAQLTALQLEVAHSLTLLSRPLTRRHGMEQFKTVLFQPKQNAKTAVKHFWLFSQSN